MRETCTIYLCQSAQQNRTFAGVKYEKLKNLCQRVDWHLMQLEDEHGLALRQHAERGQPR